MLGKAPEISETLEWMLQSRQVGDDALVRTLIQEQYAYIYRFISSLVDFRSTRRCEEITEQVILAVVQDFPGFQGDMTINAWLTKKSIAVLRDCRESPWKTHKKKMNFDAGPESDVIAQRIADWYTELTCENRLVVTMYYLFDFSQSQIAGVIDANEADVTKYLKDARNKLKPTKVEGLPREIEEPQVKKVLAKFWPSVDLNRVTAAKITQRILNELDAKKQRKRHVAFFGETLLAILAIFFVISLGGLIGRFTPEPTHEVVYETRMINHIVFVTPTPGPTRPPKPFPKNGLVYEAVEGETLLDIAEKIYFNAHILEALNDIPAEQPLNAGQRILIGIGESQVLMPTMSSRDSTPEPPPATPAALTLASEEQDVRERLSNSIDTWQTIWADALVIQHGPPGYIGEPEFRRQQMWIDQPYFYYILDGVNGGDVEFAYSVVGRYKNLLNVQTGDLLSNIGAQDLNYLPAIKEALINSDFDDVSSGNLEIIGRDIVAGRDVIVFDRFMEGGSFRGSGFEDKSENILLGRYWIDENLGVILRMQIFSGGVSNQLFQEIIITKILFDVPIPRRLYDRSQYLQTYFAKDNTGDYVHEPIDIPADIFVPRQVEGDNQYSPPPAGFEIGMSYLDFHWTSLHRFNPEKGTRVDLFADGYYLANIEFAEPEQLVCARSLDGNVLAFSSWSSELDFGFSPLGWFNLHQLQDVHFFNPDLIPFDFAFSNDSRQLAVYACERYLDKACGIYIIELESGASRLLRSVEQGAGLLWSPDGEAIAIQGSYLREGRWRLLVLDSQSGNAIYDGPFDWEGFWLAHDSPLKEWGVQYPPLRGGLETCRMPPSSE